MKKLRPLLFLMTLFASKVFSSEIGCLAAYDRAIPKLEKASLAMTKATPKAIGVTAIAEGIVFSGSFPHLLPIFLLEAAIGLGVALEYRFTAASMSDARELISQAYVGEGEILSELYGNIRSFTGLSEKRLAATIRNHDTAKVFCTDNKMFGFSGIEQLIVERYGDIGDYSFPDFE